jgi:hypothetical protein
MSIIKAEYIWIDGTEPTPRESSRRDHRSFRTPALGLRWFQHEPGDRR